MKSLRNCAAAMCLAMVFCLGAAGLALADGKAQSSTLTSSGALQFEPKDLSWDEEQVTVKGNFFNASADKDIYDIYGTPTIHLMDADGKALGDLILNTNDISSIQLAPGETWSYSVTRTISGFQPGNFNIQKKFQTRVSCEYKVRDHDGSGCSFCKDRFDTSFKTEDTMTDEEWNSLVKKLKSIVNDNKNETAAGEVDAYELYQYKNAPAKQPDKTCSKCNGAGRIICTLCGGLGYKEYQERRTCLIPNGNGHLHSRDDIVTRKQYCASCNHRGYKECTGCFGTGKTY